MAQRQAPLQLPVQPDVRAAALLPAQEAATTEHASRHAGHDQGRHHGDAVRGPGQRHAGDEPRHRGQAGADPEFVGGQALTTTGWRFSLCGKKVTNPSRAISFKAAIAAQSTPVALVSSQIPTTSRIAPTATVRPNWPQVARPVWISE